MIGADDFGEDLFRESLDRSLPSSAGEEDDDYAPTAAAYDVWIAEPLSVEERRRRLLRRMGLAGAACTPEISRSCPAFAGGEVSCSGSNGYRQRGDGGIGRPRLVSAADPDDDNNLCSSNCNLSVHFSEKILSDNSLSESVCENSSQFVNSTGVRSGNNDASPSKPLTDMNCGREDEFRYDDVGVCSEDRLSVCTIRNLDNGKEFVVNEVREDGTWDKLKEVGTGRQLTMEEFEVCVGHSPIVQELMRRQNVEDGNKDSLESNTSGSSGSGLKIKKKGSWLKSIKNVASTMTGSRDRRSSDGDTSSEKGGQRSSSATDDSQDVSFHGPERVRVRQYGKSWKELSALYKSQEIQAHNGSIWSIKFSLDGKYLASAGEDCIIHVWQVVESERKGDMLMDKPEDGNLSLLFLANGSPEPSTSLPNLEGHLEKKRRGRSSVSRKSVSIEHILVPETVFAFSEKPVCSFRGHLDDVLDLSWSKSQHLLSSSMDKTVRLWHLSSNSCLKIFSHSDYVTCIQFNPVDDNYFISGSLDAKVRIWSIPDRQVVDWNDLHEMVTAACYTPDGQGALVGSYKGSCRVYNTSENKLQQKGHINLQNKKKKSYLKKITGFQFAPGSSSEVLITSADSRVRVIDDVDLVHKFKGFRNTNSQISASVTANGKYVVCASEDSQVYIWRHDSDSRPNRSKGVTVTRSYEHFHCQDVSVAIPWPGMTDSWRYHQYTSSGARNRGDEVSTINHPPTPVQEMNVMALQAAALLPSAFSIRKEGKSGASLKESGLFGISLSDHVNCSSGLRIKKEFNPRKLSVGSVRAEAMATTPTITKATVEGKKTLRKGCVVITGASSGLGLATAKALGDTGKWHIIMACRDFLKAERAAKSAGIAKENYTVMHLDLASLDSVRQFVDNFRRSGRPLDVLVCNAAVYLPTAREPTFTADGFELSVGTNHLGHFLLSRLMLDDLKQSDYPSKRLIIVGSITGNTNTLAGNVPPKANLGDLRGFAGGLNGLNSSSMIDGGDFDGAKAYKDSKVCNMLTMQEFHRRYHEETGITFASLYPGCIATTGLFREHIPLFRTLFPPFQKYITKGYVSEEESGKRLAQVVAEPSLTKSGVYWSWNKASASFENQLSEEASNVEKARKVWELSEKLVGLA